MNILLVQGTWGDNDRWWRRGNNSFADALVQQGHTLLNGMRQFEWSTDLGGVIPGSSVDLNVWKGSGRHLYDYCDPPLAPHAKISNLTIIAHSHGRQVVRYALQYGLTADQVIFVSGPIRKDVDTDTPDFRSRVKNFICLHGGKQDRFQWFGELFDGAFGIKREDPQADLNLSYKDADHSSLLQNPAQYSRVLDLILRNP